MLKRILRSLPGADLLGRWMAVDQSAANALRVIESAQTEQLRLEILASPRHQDPRSLARFDAQVFSQTGIDGILAEVFRRIGTVERTFLEIGTESGIETNTTFLLAQGWSGWWVEGNREHVRSMQRTFERPLAERRLNVSETMVTAENISSILDNLAIPAEFDLLSIDIDRNTFWVLKAITRRPRVVVVEYNSSIPASVEWAVEYAAEKHWNGTNYYGAGLKNYERWGRETGYRLVGCDLAGFNAVFVRADLAGDLFPDPATAEHLHEPYRTCFARRYGHISCFDDR